MAATASRSGSLKPRSMRMSSMVPHERAAGQQGEAGHALLLYSLIVLLPKCPMGRLNLERPAPIWQDRSTLANPIGPMNVISFGRARARLRAPRRIEPPAALRAPVRRPQPAHGVDDVNDRLRMRQNPAAFAAIAAIVALGFWLMDSLQHYWRLQMCIEAGHRNCMPLAAKYQPPLYGATSEQAGEAADRRILCCPAAPSMPVFLGTAAVGPSLVEGRREGNPGA